MATPPTTPLMSMIEAARASKPYPVLKVAKDTPLLAALISKLVAPSRTQINYGDSGTKQVQNPDVHQMRQLAHRMGRNAGDAEMVMQMLPDMELAAQILVSSILSPKDMMSTELTVVPAEGVLDAQTTAELTVEVRQYLDQVYKITPQLRKILRDVLFTNGSHVRAVLPEGSVDEVINRANGVTLESFSDVIDPKTKRPHPYGVLGSNDREAATGLAIESLLNDDKRPPTHYVVKLDGGTFSVLNPTPEEVEKNQLKRSFETLQDPYISVTDNPYVLKMPQIAEKLRSRKLQNIYHRQKFNTSSLEAYGVTKLSDRDMVGMLYRPSRVGHKPVVVMKTREQLKRRSVGSPLVLELPPESVIPVHVPGQEEQHIGYFILLDQNGNPISRKAQRDSYAELSDRISMGSGNSSQFASQLIHRVSHLMNGFDVTNNTHLDYSARVYAEMIEADLLARLRNGVYTNGAALARNQEVYRIMLARTLQSQQTQLLFLPVDLVTYFALNYTADGIGESLMENMKILNSLRSMLMFSDVMASIRNSIGLTNLKVKIDADDPDPYKTIERAMSEYLRAKQQAFPIGVNSPVDIVNYLQRAGVDFSFEGHEGLPDIAIEKTEHNTSYPEGNEKLSENLRKRAIMATGLNPEFVEQGFNGASATSVVQDNILLSRRVLQVQESFCPLVADNIRKVFLADEGLLAKLREIVDRNWDEKEYDTEELTRIYNTQDPQELRVLAVHQLVLEYIRTLTVELPKPSVTTTALQTEALDSYTKLLDAALDAWVSPEFMTSNLSGDGAKLADDMKKTLRAHFLRKFMAENNILPELNTITRQDENGKTDQEFTQDLIEHSKSVLELFDSFLSKMQPIKDESDRVLLKAGVKNDDLGGMGAGSSSFAGPSDFGSSDTTSGFGDIADAGALPEEPGNPTTPTGETSVLPAPGAQPSDLDAIDKSNDNNNPEDQESPEL